MSREQEIIRQPGAPAPKTEASLLARVVCLIRGHLSGDWFWWADPAAPGFGHADRRCARCGARV